MMSSSSRKEVVLANKSLSGYDLMLPSQIHFFHIIGKKAADLLSTLTFDAQWDKKYRDISGRAA